MHRFIWLGLIMAVVLSGCTAMEKKITELTDMVKKLEARVDALEKMLGAQKPAKQTEAYNVPIGESPVLGNPDAKVNVVVFSNFQCPYCAMADKTLRDLLKDPKLKDQIKIVFKHFPFDRHPEAKPASKAAMAAGEQGKFWEMAEKIFTHQKDLNPKNFEKWAKDVGVNVEKWKESLKKNDAKYEELIKHDMELGAKEAHLDGTPWILVNGWLLQGELNANTITSLIQEKKMVDLP